MRDAVLHRPSAEVDRVKLRYRTQPLACRVEPGAGRPPRAAPRRAGRRRRAGPGRLPDARRRDRRARRHRVVTRCQAATVAASAISPRRDHRLELGDGEALAAQVLLGRLGRRRPGFEPGREPDVEALVGHPVGEVERPEPLQLARRAGRSPRPARRGRAPRPARPARPPTRPAGAPRSAARRGGGAARRATRRRRPAGRSPRPAASPPRRTARGSRRRARAGPRAAASSGSRRPAGTT